MKVAVLGAGFVAQPAVDYLLDQCGYEVIVTSLNRWEAAALVHGRPKGRAMALCVDQTALLDEVVSDVDLVMSMIPPYLHLPVAAACIRHRTHMVTTSYISPEMAALDGTCREREIVILNEIGEDPGLDLMDVMRTVDQLHKAGGAIFLVNSYGAGLPAPEHNNNPMGYKFSWSPMGMIIAAQTPAVYLDRGRMIQVPGESLFEHCRQVDLEGIGSFEAYPNRDCRPYRECFAVPSDGTLFRGILRNLGWCAMMKGLAALGLLATDGEIDLSATTYAAFLATCIGANDTDAIAANTAHFLNVRENSNLMDRLKWLGLFDDRQVAIPQGAPADILIDAMTSKMSYAPQERDMVILHNQIGARFARWEEEWTSTLVAKGQPGEYSAMSSAVSLPAAIAARLILEKKIDVRGVWRPTIRQIYTPVLDEMSQLGYCFTKRFQRVETWHQLEAGLETRGVGDI